MSNFDHLELDGHALRLFLAVLEEGSVTAAAERLGVTQSAVSHNLTKLRRIMRDPLFTKSGRGIVATAHAQNLAEQARFLLDQMQAFASGADTFARGTYLFNCERYSPIQLLRLRIHLLGVSVRLVG